jgi:hypothetical protein
MKRYIISLLLVSFSVSTLLPSMATAEGGIEMQNLGGPLT